MAIPEDVLSGWSHQGSTTRSAETHKSIRNALASHTWPAEMGYEAYLQGSYPNATNIRGDSDVDLAVETGSVFYHNLSAEERRRRGFLGEAPFGWPEFRQEVLKALRAYYGAELVDDSGNKSIKVLPSGGRLPADVVPCVEYRNFRSGSIAAYGMTFWTKRENVQVVNYPKVHIHNGSLKHQRTSNRYKPTVRMFKNARNRFELDGSRADKRFPSYFLECLLYNVPDQHFQGSCQSTYMSVVDHLTRASDQGTLTSFVTQSEQDLLFGSGICQWNATDALELILRLDRLWNSGR